QALLPSQSCTTFEGMQDAQHLVDGGAVFTISLPTADSGFHGFQQVITFLEEDVENVRFGIVILLSFGGLEGYRRRHAQLFIRVGAKPFDGFDQRLTAWYATLVAYRFKHLCKTVVTGLEQGE